jgi:uncharacterized protein (DUF983 family)
MLDNQCPMCNGEGRVLGNLGRLLWLRCEDCGSEFSTDDESEGDEGD